MGRRRQDNYEEFIEVEFVDYFNISSYFYMCRKDIKKYRLKDYELEELGYELCEYSKGCFLINKN
jgi:hypothetical protein